MSGLAQLGIWNDPAVRRTFLVSGRGGEPSSRQVSHCCDRRHGARSCGESEEALWAELDRLTPLFLARWRAIRAGAPLPPASDGPSLLELCRELAYRMLGHCNFCPWNCRVDRVVGSQVRRMQACLRLKGQLAFPSHGRGAVLSRHRRLGDDLLHLLQHALRLLPER